MKTKLLIAITFFTFFSCFDASAQKVVGKISKEICNCLESYKNLQDQAEIDAAMESCIMKSSMKHLEDIKKELNIDMTQGEVAGRQFGEVIAYELIKKCDIFLKFIMMVSSEENSPVDSLASYEESAVLNPDLVPYEKFSTDTMSATSGDCLSLRNAKLMYASENPDKIDYFILDGKTCTEYHENGKYISHYKINWENDCQYVSVFIDSSNPEINNLLVKGDKIYYQILGVYSNEVYINLDYKGFSKTFKMILQK
ncbi:MAG TPA: hypothetical protein VNB90_12460 [Cytophagaceae bacterium]|nr:hypothetical protein [Cytophagaceae bacterium]